MNIEQITKAKLMGVSVVTIAMVIAAVYIYKKYY